MSALSFVQNMQPIPVCSDFVWPKGCAELFTIGPKSGSGEGELSVAAAMLGIEVNDPKSPVVIDALSPFISGQHETFDVCIDERRIARLREMFPLETANWSPPQSHFGKIEVKKPTVSGVFKSGVEGMLAVAENYGYFRELSQQVRQAVRELDEYLELTLPRETYEHLLEFSEHDVTMIAVGTMSRGRVMGAASPSKHVNQKFGLYQAVSVLSQLKRAKLNLSNKQWNVNVSETALWLTAKPHHVVEILKVFNLFDSKMNVALSKLDLNNLQIDILRCLSHPAFDDPDEVIRRFVSIAPASKTFRGVDMVTLVSNEKMRVYPHAVLDSEFEIEQVVQGGRPCYRAKSFTSPSA